MKSVIAKKSYIPAISTGFWTILLTLFVLIPNQFGSVLKILVIILIVFLVLDIIYTLIRPHHLILHEEHTFIVHHLGKTQIVHFKDIVKIDFYKATRRGYELHYGTIIIQTKDNNSIRIPEVEKVIDTYFAMNHLIDEYTINNT
ncbi:MAG: hypothetical protein PHY42_04675 [Bacilli bacterium]|jgi:hypothetical protein|nr:hypothetical protein [Bacilli bacterium]